MSRRFLTPSRRDPDGLVAGLTAAVPSGDAWAAWQALVDRGLIPQVWLTDRRRFVHDAWRERRSPQAPTRDPLTSPSAVHPRTLSDCAAYASDVVGIELAEAHARVLVERLAPWGAAPFSHVVWWTLPRSFYGRVTTDTRPNVSYGLLFAIVVVHRMSPELPRSAFGEAAQFARAWDRLARAGATIPEGKLAGRGFADLPNPFEPLAAIESLGYAGLEWIGSRGQAVLVAPEELTA
jgi:hypothetical protein